MDTYVRWAFILACMVLVLWVRTLPLSLHGVEERAEHLVQQQLRVTLAREAAQSSSAPSERISLDNRVEQWIERNPEQFAARKAATVQSLRELLKYTGSDGKERVYLGGVDSYLWLRHARNYLKTGTTCDAIVEGECRDTYGTAPVGSQMRYRQSLHISAIVAMHKLMTLFNPDYPLPASAFLVQVIVGMAGVIPAFFIGRGLVGNVGGLCAALLVSLQSVFLLRSINSDNDVWNVVLPLCMMWAIMRALAAPERPQQIAFTVLAAAWVGLQAGAWRGWYFMYSIILLGLLARLSLAGLRYAFREETWRVWQGQKVQEAALIAGVFYAAVGCFIFLVGASLSSALFPVQIFESLLQRLFGGISFAAASAVVDNAPWPETLDTVDELTRPGFWFIVNSLGGPLAFCGALLGLVLLIMPKDRWEGRHWLIMGVSAFFYGSLLSRNAPGRLDVFGLLMLPIAGGLLLRCFLDDEKTEEVEAGPEVIVALWFLAGFYVAYDGIRFLLQTGMAFGVVFAVAAGRLFFWLGRLLERQIPNRSQWPAYALASLVLAVIMFPPIRLGYVTARGYTPRMSDGWWDTLEKIRAESAADAIINAWWDYGHWAKYAAERRVSADGSSLLTHVPHWLGKALAAPSDTESVGVLRMLNCGSDALPTPEGSQGAYGKVLEKVGDGLVAHQMVTDLVTRTAAQAREYLAQRGFSPSEQDNVLRSTHCQPPESYLIVNGELVNITSAWLHLGLWDFRRAYIVNQARFFPLDEAVADLQQRFGYTEEEATRLYTQAKQLRSNSQVANFIAPKMSYLSSHWIPCRTEGEGTGATLTCPVNLVASQAGSVLETVLIRPTAPLESKLHFRLSNTRRNRDLPAEGTPGVIIIAGAEEKEDIVFPSPTYPRVGILVDVPKQRILIGPPALLRSTFTHLFYLDGRYTKAFEKFDERLTYTGDRVVTWKVKWNSQDEPPATGDGTLPNHSPLN